MEQPLLRGGLAREPLGDLGGVGLRIRWGGHGGADPGDDHGHVGRAHLARGDGGVALTTGDPAGDRGAPSTPGRGRRGRPGVARATAKAAAERLPAADAGRACRGRLRARDSPRRRSQPRCARRASGATARAEARAQPIPSPVNGST